MKNTLLYFVFLFLISCTASDIKTPEPDAFLSEWHVERVNAGLDDVTEEFSLYRIVFNSVGTYVLYTKDNLGNWIKREGSYRFSEEVVDIVLDNDPDLENYSISDTSLTFFQRQFTDIGEQKLFFRLKRP